MTLQKTAFITGGASGIGRALAALLLSQGWNIFIADRDLAGAKSFVDEHDPGKSRVSYAQCDTASWDSQVNAFKEALKAFGGRVDFVAPIAGVGERQWLPTLGSGPHSAEGEFIKPDLSVVDTDLTGVLYTVALAVQQFRRQQPVQWSGSSTEFRGRIGFVASICGFYCIPSVPIYTAAKHAVIGLTRSYGKLLEREGITANVVAPNVVRTAISPSLFYDRLESLGLMTKMDGLMDAFQEMIDGSQNAEVYECGPRGGYTKRIATEYLDEESRKCCEIEGTMAYQTMCFKRRLLR